MKDIKITGQNFINTKCVCTICTSYTVRPRSTDLPKNGQPRYSGQTQNYGWISYILGASEIRTFRVPDNGQNRIPTIATPYNKCT